MYVSAQNNDRAKLQLSWKHNLLAWQHPDNPPQNCYAETGPKPRLYKVQSEPF